jgi:hypothetical protein
MNIEYKNGILAFYRENQFHLMEPDKDRIIEFVNNNGLYYFEDDAESGTYYIYIYKTEQDKNLGEKINKRIRKIINSSTKNENYPDINDEEITTQEVIYDKFKNRKTKVYIPSVLALFKIRISDHSTPDKQKIQSKTGVIDPKNYIDIDNPPTVDKMILPEIKKYGISAKRFVNILKKLLF